METLPSGAQGIQTDNLKEPPDKKVLTIALVGNPNTGKSTLFNALTGLRQQIANYPGITVERKTGIVTIGDKTCRITDLPGTYSLNSKKMDERITSRALFGTVRNRGNGSEGRDEVSSGRNGISHPNRVDDDRSGSYAEPPDLVLNVVDASNPDRNLFLTTQLLDTGLPMLVVLTMDDIARQKGIAPDPEKLQIKLGVPVISVTATDRRAADTVKNAIQKVPLTGSVPLKWHPDPALLLAVEHVTANWIEPHTSLPPSAHIIEALRLISDEQITSPFYESAAPPELQMTAQTVADEARAMIRQAGGNPVAVEVLNRYDFIGDCTSISATRSAGAHQAITDRIDAVVTHRVFGPAIFALILMLIFQAIFSWAAPFMDLIDLVFVTSAAWLSANLPSGILNDLLTEGVLAGLGGVVIFLPQILFLFFFINILEGSGYMARAAFVMDGLMSRIGLHGRSVVPLVSGFACAIPGIMATRNIENPRDRFITIMVLPFMTCSARLPVYALLIAAFIPPTLVLGFLSMQAVVFFGLYFFGIFMAVLAALVLNRILPKGKPNPFVMELPNYRMPDWRVVFTNAIDRGRVFVAEAGKIIIAISIVLWFLASYPKVDGGPQASGTDVPESGPAYAMAEAPGSALQTRDARTGGDETFAADGNGNPPSSLTGLLPNGESVRADETTEALQLKNSYAGQFGSLIEPVIRPLGFDWKIGIGLITSFAAREVIVGTLNTIYSIGADNGSAEPLRQKLINDTHADTGQPVYTIATALSLMVFFALAMQCMSTIAVVRRETGTWKWPLVMLGYMTTLAYVCSFVTYQVVGMF
jgi:ferrous iron transport protein B